MKVNLGCGDQYAPGWVNVDHAGCPHRKDLTLDLRGSLPWGPGQLTKVYAGHFFEHLKVYEVIDVLHHLRPCVSADGELMIILPDCDIAQGMAVAGTLEVTLDSLRYGADRWTGDVHRWECSLPSMEALVKLTGWTVVKTGDVAQVPAEWPVAYRGPLWQTYVLARP